MSRLGKLAAYGRATTGDDQRGRTFVPATRVRGGRKRRELGGGMLLIFRYHVRPVRLALAVFSLAPAISSNFAGHSQMIHFSKA